MKTYILSRSCEVVFSISILIILSPIILLILITVFFLTGEYPLVKQNRKIALNKKNIVIYKIRTIKSSYQFKVLEEAHKNIFYKFEYEKFVPKFCKWLRKSGLDELPQLLNVLIGNMSLIGPRPMTINDLINMKQNDNSNYRIREMINSKAGISGYWQIFGDRDKGISNLCELDLYYENNKTFFLDFKILVITIFTILSANHSDSIINDKHKKLLYK